MARPPWAARSRVNARAAAPARGRRKLPGGVEPAARSRDQPLDGPGHGNVPVPGLDAERGRRERLLPASSIEQAPGEKSVERPAGNPRIELLAKLPRLAG